MDEITKKLLEKNGFDVEETMKRFMNNEELYRHCLNKFLTDPNYEKLHQALEAGNCEEAFRAAHTMKGFVSNLGMERLYAALYPVVEKTRAKDMQVTEEMTRLDNVYQETCQLLKKI